MATTTRIPSRPGLGETRARQGRLGRHVLFILLVSVALSAIALFGSWAWRSGDLAATEPNNARQPADAQAFNAPDPAPIQAPSANQQDNLAMPAR